MKVLLGIVFLFLATYSPDIFGVTVAKSQTELTATTTSTKYLENNSLRNYLLIVNKGSVTIYVKFGSASTGTDGVPIVAGGNYEPFEAPIDSVYIKSSSGSQPVLIFEGNKQ